jgi:chemotaxis protein MotB
MADDKPIIIIKKKGHHGGHHGGAWKVAYADFVTAMMAFFMVMWLLNTADTQTRKAIASYFRKPGIFDSASLFPIDLQGAGILPDSYQPPSPKSPEETTPWQLRKRLPTLKEEIEQERRSTRRYKGVASEKNDEAIDPKAPLIPVKPKIQGYSLEAQAPREREEEGTLEDEYLQTALSNRKKDLLEALRQKMKASLEKNRALADALGDIDIKVESDGILLEIMDSSTTSMFQSGSSQITSKAAQEFKKLSSVIAPFQNTLEILGHTDAQPFSNRPGGYSNWDLSSERANTARRLLEEGGIPNNRIISVVGKAATMLKVPEEPFAPKNRRISVRMKFSAEDIEVLANKFPAVAPLLPPPPPAEAQPTSKDGETRSTLPQNIPESQNSSNTTRSQDDGVTVNAYTKPLASETKVPTPVPIPTMDMSPRGIANQVKNQGPLPLPPDVEKNPDILPPQVANVPLDVFGRSPVVGPEMLMLFSEP